MQGRRWGGKGGGGKRREGERLQGGWEPGGWEGGLCRLPNPDRSCAGTARWTRGARHGSRCVGTHAVSPPWPPGLLAGCSCCCASVVMDAGKGAGCGGASVGGCRVCASVGGCCVRVVCVCVCAWYVCGASPRLASPHLCVCAHAHMGAGHGSTGARHCGAIAHARVGGAPRAPSGTMRGKQPAGSHATARRAHVFGVRRALSAPRMGGRPACLPSVPAPRSPFIHPALPRPGPRA